MDDIEAFKVSRKPVRIFAWVLILAAVLNFGLFMTGDHVRLLIGAIILFVFGVHLLLSVINVEEIVVSAHSISFLPINQELQFSEIDKMSVPDWVDRSDTPPNALGSLILTTNTETVRYVPGAIIKYGKYCRLNFQGCDGNRMIAVLRKHIAE